ncbi:MAG: YgeY family selenium metabolism-linked hydrolase [Anaerolineae bacterium]|nr:YgeY family selenium metabolism-linked hydrolase [Anaerolineae bacterium]
MKVNQEIASAARQIEEKSLALNERMVQFLADLIRIRSYTGQEKLAVERTLQELKTVGCDEVWMDTAGNALGRIGNGRHLILYDAHLDTNEVTDEREWRHPPLEPVIESGVLYGLGASDCKGGVAPIVYSAAILKELGLVDDFTLIIMGATLEEDAEGFALRSLVERDGLRPHVVLIAEASDLTLRIGQRGRCEVRVRTLGKAAHASQPELGENAIIKMAPILMALDGMCKNLPQHPVFGQDNQVVSLINGPHTPNSVPSWCEIAIDRRIGPGETMETILAEIRSVVGPLGGEAYIPDQPVLTHTGQRLDGPSFYPGWLLSEDSPLLEIGKETYRSLWSSQPEVGVWRFSTDGTYSAGVANIPTLGFGPQEAQYVHTPEDQINLEKMRKAAMFYALFPLVYVAMNKNH